MKVLADLHHGVLYEGLAMLFEDRYGWEMRAWVDGYYVTEPGPRWVDFPPREITALTTDHAEWWRPDYVVSTVGRTRHAMKDLAHLWGAVYVDHVGNAWDEPIGDLVLRSVAGSYGIPYHPEFHRVEYRDPSGNRIGAFHNSLATSPCRELWDEAQSLFRDWDFVLYGTPDNPLYPWQVAEAMRDCAVIWHDKEADGYGFTVHEAFASGRPVVGHNHYQGKFAEPLWTIETAITLSDSVRPLNDLLVFPERRTRMGRSAIANFDLHVDFDREAQDVFDYLMLPLAVAV